MDELSVFEQRLTAGLEAIAGSRRAVDGLGIARSAAARAAHSTPVLVRLIGTLAPRGRSPAPATIRLAILAVAATLLLLGLGFAAGSGLVRLPSFVQPAPSTFVPPSPSSQASRGSGSWTVTGKMQYLGSTSQDLAIGPGSGVTGDTATLLPNGQVLVVGGTGAELYDPTTGHWTQTGSLHSSHRGGHSATLLPDGKVLVAGGDQLGLGHPPQSGAELYDPATGTWTETGSMAVARSYHSATLLPNGKVLVAGGVAYTRNSRQASNGAELYDPTTGIWASTGSMTGARWLPSAALLPDGNVLVVGGDPNATQSVQSAELYDPNAGTWASAKSFQGFGSCRVAAALLDGRVLVVCAEGKRTSGALFDPASGTWATVQPPPTQCCGGAVPQGSSVLLSDGRVLWKDLLDAGELFDPASGTWASAGAPTYPADPSWGLPYTGTDEGRGYQADTLTVLPDGKVLMTTLGAGLLYDPNEGR